MAVLDAGVLVAALAERGGRGASAREAVRRTADQHVLHLTELEVVSALRLLVHGGRVTATDAERALRNLLELPLVSHPHQRLLARCWRLRENLTPYDAAYVALAEILDEPLVTTDRRLAQAPGLRCQIHVLRA